MLALRVRENELDGLQRNTVFVMKGGDVLCGKVDSSVIKVEAKEPGEGEVDPALMRNVASGTGYVACAVRESISQGDTEYRTDVLVGDHIAVVLDLGPTVGLARDDVQTIFFRSGYADVIGPHDEDLTFALRTRAPVIGDEGHRSSSATWGSSSLASNRRRSRWDGLAASSPSPFTRRRSPGLTTWA